MDKPDDAEYQDGVIVEVEADGTGWVIKWAEDGDPIGPLWFGVPPESPVTPAPGMRVRFYGGGFGSIVRGLDIDGREVFYRTPEQQATKNRREQAESDRRRRAAFEAERERWDATVAALPDPLRTRVERFRRVGGAEWRWRFEPYEAFVCEQAAAMAAAFPSRTALIAFHKERDWEVQRRALPSLSDQHSGNTFGAACRLAALLIEQPAMVSQEHGALCPLVGCREYGCWTVGGR